jgi:N-methylhydantoinase B/oxoprolinase/acetone carboxylase alpha subunit
MPNWWKSCKFGCKKQRSGGTRGKAIKIIGVDTEECQTKHYSHFKDILELETPGGGGYGHKDDEVNVS